MQRRAYGHVKNEKVTLGGLGHLKDWVPCSYELFITFISVCYATFILLEIFCIYVRGILCFYVCLISNC
jgi:hypothetical protein